MRALVIAIAAVLAASPALAGEDAARAAGAAAPAPSASAPLASGEIRKVDKDARKLTIRHGPLPRFDMPAMTMVFQVKDPAMLDQVKPGDKVRFDVEKVGGAYTVTVLEPAP